MFRFRFHALLAVRRREELARQAELVDASNAERGTSDRCVALERAEAVASDALLHAMHRASSIGVADGGLAAVVRHLADLRSRLTIARAARDDASRRRAEAALRVEAAARPRRALERLEAAERERYDRARARAEETEYAEANLRRADGRT